MAIILHMAYDCYDITDKATVGHLVLYKEALSELSILFERKPI